MRAWQLGILFVAALVLARLSGPPAALPAAELDALAGGVLVADHLTADGEVGTKARLRAGFEATPDHPLRGALRRDADRRARLSDAPLPRWIAATSVMVLPEASTNYARTRWGAAFAFALGAALLAWAAARKDAPTGLAAAALLALLPGALDGAAGAGAAAGAVLAIAALTAAMRRLETGQGGGLLPGIAWGLALAVHPGALFLLVPIFAAVAIARPPAGAPSTDAGALRLPSVPASTYAAPVVGLIVLVALWPALWSETGKQLAAWLTDTWWHMAPDQRLAGVGFAQGGGGRAPQAFSALVQWVSATPLTVLGAWLVGVAVTARAGRAGWWFPVLTLATLLVVGGADGGLFGARKALWAMVWVPTAATAAVGALALFRWALTRLPWSPRTVAAAVAVAVVGPAVAALAGAPSLRARSAGMTAADPLPLALLTELAAEQPGARVHLGPRPGEHALDLAWTQAEIDVAYSPVETADWLVVVGRDRDPGVAPLVQRIEGRAPDRATTAMGAPVRAWKLR